MLPIRLQARVADGRVSRGEGARSLLPSPTTLSTSQQTHRASMSSSAKALALALGLSVVVVALPTVFAQSNECYIVEAEAEKAYIDCVETAALSSGATDARVEVERDNAQAMLECTPVLEALRPPNTYDICLERPIGSQVLDTRPCRKIEDAVRALESEKADKAVDKILACPAPAVTTTTCAGACTSKSTVVLGVVVEWPSGCQVDATVCSTAKPEKPSDDSFALWSYDGTEPIPCSVILDYGSYTWDPENNSDLNFSPLYWSTYPTVETFCGNDAVDEVVVKNMSGRAAPFAVASATLAALAALALVL